MTNKNKYIGQKFGRLTVIDINKKNGKCICQCECDNIKEVEAHNLTNGSTKSCGCLAIEVKLRQEQKQIKEMVGKKFGRLTVLSKAPSKCTPKGNKYSMWNCICDCGNECIVRGTALKKGKTTSCGCYNKERSKEACFKDLTGLRFSRLFVCREAKELSKKKKKTIWICYCDCGNISFVATSNLTNGHTTSCGCKIKENAHGRYKDLTGMTFGKLKVIEKVGTIIKNNGNQVVLWNCLCQCGGEAKVISSDLISGKKQSCGCMRSVGEFEVKKYLDAHKINYEPQKKFSDLTGIKGGYLSYDFYLPDFNLLIECQGEQHYKSVKLWGGANGLLKRQEHDRRKKEYAKNHNISLFEIDSSEYNNIEEVLNNRLVQNLE